MAPSNDFLSQLSMSNIAGRLADFPRYATIAQFFVIDIFIQYHIPFLVLLASIFILRAYRPSLAGGAIITIAICYFFVYVITQSDLLWNLGTSGKRLFQHIFPSIIFVLLVGISKSDHPWINKLSRLNSKL